MVHTLRKEELERDVLLEQWCEYEFGPCAEGSSGFRALSLKFSKATLWSWDPKPRIDLCGLMGPVYLLWDTL